MTRKPRSRPLALLLIAASTLALAVGTSDVQAAPAPSGEAPHSSDPLAGGADAPDPRMCRITPCDALGGVVLVPDVPVVAPTTQVIVDVRNASNAPIMGAAVTCYFHTGTALCPTAVIAGVTSSSGRVEFRFPGGGCLSTESAVVIEASKMVIRSFAEIKSPDYDGASADGRVNIADLVQFSGEFLGGPAGCHDYDNSGITNLADLVIFSPAFVGASHCP